MLIDETFFLKDSLEIIQVEHEAMDAQRGSEP